MYLQAHYTFVTFFTKAPYCLSTFLHKLLRNDAQFATIIKGDFPYGRIAPYKQNSSFRDIIIIILIIFCFVSKLTFLQNIDKRK